MPTSLLPLADRIAIEDLLTDMSLAVDDSDLELFASLITDDISFEVGFGEMVGRDAVVAGFEASLKRKDFEARHLWSNLKILSVDGDEVRLRCVFVTFAVIERDGERNRMWRCGDYYDTARRQGESWKMASRRLVLALPD